MKTWLKGGIIVSLLSIIILPLIILVSFILGFGTEIFNYIALPLFVMLWKIEVLESPSLIYILFSYAIGIFLTLLQYFIIGAVFGLIVGVSKYKKTVIVSLIIISIIFFFFIMYRYPSEITYDPKSIEDCNRKISEAAQFDRNRCLELLAVSKEDLSICDEMEKFRGSDNNKWNCYSEVARARDDSSICELIPENVYNEHGIETGIKDHCFGDLRICERIKNSGWRNNCLKAKNSN